MQEKLIVTVWKAQFREVDREGSIYCRVTYNNTERNTKPTTIDKNLTWKETFIFPLAKQESPLKLEFIGLREGEAIHFAKEQVAESLSFGRAVMNVDVDSPHRGTLPSKLDIMGRKGEPVGKIFIEYEMMKTEVAYTVEKQLDYFYLLKLTAFKVSFVRKLKTNLKFYLHFSIEGKTHKQILPFEEHESGTFVYNYPVKLYLKKQIEAELILFVKEEDTAEYALDRRDNQSQSSFSESIFSEKKTFKSSVGKKDKLWLELGKEKVAAVFDLNFKRDVKVKRSLPLSTIIKFQKRDIGNIEFQAEALFRSKEQLSQLDEQKKGVVVNPESRPERKKVVKQTNGAIVINSILGKLELFNESVIEGKDMSVEVKLGSQIKESQILERPGKEIIFIDTFTFKRTWEETIKLIINLHSSHYEKLPAYFAELNLRELFQVGRLTSKKVKLKDENRNYAGELVLDVEYKEVEEKRSPSLKQDMGTISEVPQEQGEEVRVLKKKEEIVERMKHRKELKDRAKELNSMSTLAVLQSNDIILPPLKAMSRLSTIDPKNQKAKGAQCFNVNGSIKFTRSPRFENQDSSGYESYTYVRESEFDGRRKKGTSIGYGSKHDFTKDTALTPGAGRYEIQSVWDKYK